MSLQDFKAQVMTDGLARMNRFVVEFGLPRVIQKDMYDLKVVQLLCESATLPSLNISTQPNRSFGEQREIVYDRTFEPVTLTFHVDTSMVVKSFFDTWLDGVINPTTRALNYYEEYITTVTITVLDIADKKSYEVVLYEAYPKMIGAITLDNNSKDTMKISVTFNYKHHLSGRLDRLGGQPKIDNTFKSDKYETYYDTGTIPSNYFNGPTPMSFLSKEEYDNEISRLEARANAYAVSKVLPNKNNDTYGIFTTGGDFYTGSPI